MRRSDDLRPRSRSAVTGRSTRAAPPWGFVAGRWCWRGCRPASSAAAVDAGDGSVRLRGPPRSCARFLASSRTCVGARGPFSRRRGGPGLERSQRRGDVSLERSRRQRDPRFERKETRRSCPARCQRRRSWTNSRSPTRPQIAEKSGILDGLQPRRAALDRGRDARAAQSVYLASGAAERLWPRRSRPERRPRETLLESLSGPHWSRETVTGFSPSFGPEPQTSVWDPDFGLVSFARARWGSPVTSERDGP